MDFAKKLKAIRLAEELEREDMSQLVDIPRNTIRNYEQGQNTPKVDSIIKIVKHDRFKKYLFWLMVDHVMPEAGQVRPPPEILRQFESIESKDDKEVGKKIKAIRLAEKMNEDAFSSLFGLKKKHLVLIETCKQEPTVELVSQISSHEQFEKYALWLANNKVIPDSGQIAPSDETLKSCKLKVNSSK